MTYKEEYCKACDSKLIGGDNYPEIHPISGVGICDPCWDKDIPDYIPVSQLEKYIVIRERR